MSDPAASPQTPAGATPNPAPKPSKPRKPAAAINLSDLDDIAASRAVAQTASDPAYLPTLTDPAKGAVAPGEPASIIAAADTATNVTAPAVAVAKHAKEIATSLEAGARDIHMADLRKIKSAVTRKFGNTSPAKLRSYFIGDHEFDSNRAKLQTAGQAMFDLAPADNLPGITPAFLTQAATHRKDWMDADDDQQKKIKAMASAVAALTAAASALSTRVIDIKLAANSCWPCTDPANAVIRRAFNLPENKPYLG